MTTDQPAMRISGPAELIDAVPYLLGFHPTESLVLVGLRTGSLVVTARLDLDTTLSQVEHTVTALHLNGGNQLITMVMTARPITMNARLSMTDLVDQVAALAGRRNVDIVDVLLVDSTSWRSYTCAEWDAAPPRATGSPTDPLPSPRPPPSPA